MRTAADHSIQIILSSPAYTYCLGLLAKATSVIPIFSASSTPEFMGALLLTRTGKPALAGFGQPLRSKVCRWWSSRTRIDRFPPEEQPERFHPRSLTYFSSSQEASILIQKRMRIYSAFPAGCPPFNCFTLSKICFIVCSLLSVNSKGEDVKGWK